MTAGVVAFGSRMMGLGEVMSKPIFAVCLFPDVTVYRFKAPFTPSASTRPIKLMLKIRSIHIERVVALGVNGA